LPAPLGTPRSYGGKIKLDGDYLANLGRGNRGHKKEILRIYLVSRREKGDVVAKGENEGNPDEFELSRGTTIGLFRATAG
jgi:hypothetical protein